VGLLTKGREPQESSRKKKKGTLRPAPVWRRTAEAHGSDRRRRIERKKRMYEKRAKRGDRERNGDRRGRKPYFAEKLHLSAGKNRPVRLPSVQTQKKRDLEEKKKQETCSRIWECASRKCEKRFCASATSARKKKTRRLVFKKTEASKGKAPGFRKGGPYDQEDLQKEAGETERRYGGAS